MENAEQWSLIFQQRKLNKLINYH